MNRAMFSVFMSVFVHFLLMWLIAFAPIAPPLQTETVQIEILDPDKQLSQNAKQIVREAVVPEKEKAPESEDPLRFWSNQTQRVRKQTRAANVGMTQNRSNTADQKPSRDKEQEQQSQLERELANGDLMVEAQQQNEARKIPMPTLRGSSTIGESIPQEVEVGSFTSLNTDRYLFYSFYSRVEQLIRYRWESAVERAIDTTEREKLQANTRNRWSTQIEVLVKPNGDLLKVLVMKESGIPGFDRAAISAFTQARYFPNPPAEMVQEDGLIHLKYSFTVHFDPRLLARPY
jgi:TonB family protein